MLAEAEQHPALAQAAFRLFTRVCFQAGDAGSASRMSNRSFHDPSPSDVVDANATTWMRIRNLGPAVNTILFARLYTRPRTLYVCCCSVEPDEYEADLTPTADSSGSR